MRKLKIIGVLIFILMLPTFLKAQKLTFSLGLKVEYAQPVDRAYKGDFMSGLLFVFKIGENFGLEIDSGNWKSKIEEKKYDLYPGELSITPILVNTLFFLPLNKSFIPYIGGGFGYYFNHFQISKELITIPEVTISQSVKDEFGFHFGAGLDFFIAQNLVLNLDVKYCLISPEGTTTITDINEGISLQYFDIKLNNILLRAGVKIYF